MRSAGGESYRAVRHEAPPDDLPPLGEGRASETIRGLPGGERIPALGRAGIALGLLALLFVVALVAAPWAFIVLGAARRAARRRRDPRGAGRAPPGGRARARRAAAAAAALRVRRGGRREVAGGAAVRRRARHAARRLVLADPARLGPGRRDPRAARALAVARTGGRPGRVARPDRGRRPCLSRQLAGRPPERQRGDGAAPVRGGGGLSRGGGAAADLRLCADRLPGAGLARAARSCWCGWRSTSG